MVRKEKGKPKMVKESLRAKMTDQKERARAASRVEKMEWGKEVARRARVEKGRVPMKCVGPAAATEPQQPSSASPAASHDGPEPAGPPPGFSEPNTAPGQRRGRKLNLVNVECAKCQNLVLRGMTHCNVCSAELEGNTELPDAIQ